MKRLPRYLIGLAVLVLLMWLYSHREPALVHLSSFGSAKLKRYDESTYAGGYMAARDSAESYLWLRAKIRWDLWCVAMSATVAGPKEKDGHVFFIVEATDRTDTRCIYVFDSKGSLVEVAFQPLA